MLFLELAAHENICRRLRSYQPRQGPVHFRQRYGWLQIRVPHPQVRDDGLSGVNQQKLLASRWVAIRPRILLLDEPTYGVDVRAKSEIYRMMNDVASQGIAILMISSELPAVVRMSYPVYVMREGAIAGELRGDDMSQEKS